MAEQGITIAGEEKEAHANPQTAAEIIEKKARDKGWAPEGEWRGPIEDWVDAKEFIGRQKLFDRIKDQKEAIHSLKQSFEKDMKVIQKAFLEMSEVQYKKALADLKAQRQVAIEDRDTKQVEALDEEIDETKAKLKETQKAPTQAQQESPAFIEWKKENQWFETNAEMRADAVAVGVGYSAANPNKTEQDIYAYVVKKVKKMYPEEFGEGQEEKEEKGERKVSNSVEGGGASASGKTSSRKSSKMTVGDLDDSQRQVMKTLIKRNTFADAAKKAGISQEEYYLQQYEENANKK